MRGASEVWMSSGGRGFLVQWENPSHPLRTPPAAPSTRIGALPIDQIQHVAESLSPDALKHLAAHLPMVRILVPFPPA